MNEKNKLRADAPYIATRTDWYNDSKNLSRDKIQCKDHLGVNKDITRHF